MPQDASPAAALAAPGYHRSLPNAEYHAGPGVSKSQLDLVHECPALLLWSRRAPRDETAVAAVDIGDAFHALLLEPHRFRLEYLVAPVAERRTKAGKDEWADFQACARGRTVLSAEDWLKLRLMRESVLAHPVARRLLEDEGDVEPSIYWTDPETGELCRFRPDKLIRRRRIILDLKTTADLDRFAASVHDYRYHVQDAFYSEGYTQHFGGPPDGFVFIAASTSRDAGRYPVKVFSLTAAEKDAGRDEFRADLATYHRCRTRNEWPGVQPLERPAWARR